MSHRSGKRPLTIAIDGPAGAGKSTVARIVAERLGYLYVDTGAMYRALTLKALNRQIPPTDEAALSQLAHTTTIRLERGPEGNRVYLDGVEVTQEIRSQEVTQWVSPVSAVPAVRRHMVDLQRQMAAGGGAVVDGRDIGSYVLPDADRKFFVTATLEERARRRQEQLLASGYHVSLEEIQADLARRDALDSSRALAPLVQAPDAVHVDTSGRTVDEVVELILAHCRED